MLLDPGAEVLDPGQRLFHRRGVEAGIEHIVDSVPVDSLLVLLADFEDASSEGRLEEWRDGLLRQLLGRSLDLLLRWCAGDARKLLRSLDPFVGLAGAAQ